MAASREMTILVVGATGATGRLLVGQLLGCGHGVKAMVRSPDRLPEALKHHDHLTVIRASVLDLSDAEMARHVDGWHTRTTGRMMLTFGPRGARSGSCPAVAGVATWM